MNADNKRTARPLVAAGIVLTLVLAFATQTLAQHERQIAQAGPPTKQGRGPCPQATNLPEVPEFTSDANHRLKATVKTIDGLRVLWTSPLAPGANPNTTQCGTVYMRYFTGHSGLDINAPDDPRFASGDPLPGPTLRANVGDTVEIAFLNQINAKHFGKSLDRGELDPSGGVGHVHGTSTIADPVTGCDVVTRFTQRGPGGVTRANNDVFPNCFHGSSTTNLHFHGTHTTPGTTGDNVLLFVRPALRKNDVLLQPYTNNVNAAMTEFFRQCEATGYPKDWTAMTDGWKKAQYAAVNYYDENTSLAGGKPPLPYAARLWPQNEAKIKAGGWPQYSIGGSPVCFPLPAYDPRKQNPPRMRTMGQAPGTHWYHAHKHGSTALNVANSMVGALIIQGDYDKTIKAFYQSTPGWDYKERVLVIQQLAGVLNKTAPRPAANLAPGSLPVPVLSVNGRRSPVITMRPNQVQLFRLINAAERDGIVFQNFSPEPNGSAPCSGPVPSPTPCVHWNQTAQDGVQFAPTNYDPGFTDPKVYKGLARDRSFYLAPANRADLLVQAPAKPGRYDLTVTGQVCSQLDSTCAGSSIPAQQVLFTVSVEEPAGVRPIPTPMPFMPAASFPRLPKFLADINPADISIRRDLVFQDKKGLRINGEQFRDKHVDQKILLNAVEEWTVSNMDPDKEHPFHIHINPFQIVEVFRPQNAEFQPGGKCAVDPTDPTTWKPRGACANPWQKDFIWWDTFAIPAGTQEVVQQACSALTNVPANNKTAATPTTCTVTIPGYFKMRSQFVDYVGQYVLHCHILTHEDRGMMQLVEVVPDTSIYTHH